tara:strand:- start:1070 stop:2617 length:1548 start_codon:yes stop_codon:yes gene_type:complete
MLKYSDLEYIKKEYKKIQNLFLGGQYEAVINKTKILLKKDPEQVTFYNYIGLSYSHLGKIELGKKTFLKGLEIFPKNTSLLINLSSLLRISQNFEEAENNLKKVLIDNPKHFTAICNLANVKRDLNKDYEATKLYEKAYSIDKTNIRLLINLSVSYQTIGNFDKCKEILKQIELNNPTKTIQDKIYSSIHKYSENDEHQKLMIKKTLDTKIPTHEKINLYFSLGKAYADQNNHEKSSEYFIKGNNEKRKTLLNYNTKDEEKLKDLVLKKFENFNFENSEVVSQPDLIFIVGLPRSGTTLLHQIISSHSKVFGAGELPIMRSNMLKNIFDKNWLENLLNDYEFRKKISNEMLVQFKLQDKKLIILDKAPLNFQWIGFIKILFPNAKIIHSKRNLRDTTLSIYKNVFEEINMPWSYNQDELLTFINIYKDFMSFWHNKIPNYIYDCNYENLVENQVEETKRLIEFCNLEWEENCIDYTKNNSGIKTISLSQARSPIYKSSVNLSDYYRKSLKFLDKI